MHDTEDKLWWVNKGRQDEDFFVDVISKNIGLDAKINPMKKYNPYVPDLIVNGELADLKHQTTPFFKSYDLYKIPNRFAVTFNYKDFCHYWEKYPNLFIYYWVDWHELSKDIHGFVYKVAPLFGVWVVPFEKLALHIIDKKIPLHTYKRRAGDTEGNGKDSFIFDIRRAKYMGGLYEP